MYPNVSCQTCRQTSCFSYIISPPNISKYARESYWYVCITILIILYVFSPFYSQYIPSNSRLSWGGETEGPHPFFAGALGKGLQPQEKGRDPAEAAAAWWSLETLIRRGFTGGDLTIITGIWPSFGGVSWWYNGDLTITTGIWPSFRRGMGR